MGGFFSLFWSFWYCVVFWGWGGGVSYLGQCGMSLFRVTFLDRSGWFRFKDYYYYRICRDFVSSFFFYCGPTLAALGLPFWRLWGPFLAVGGGGGIVTP